MSEALKDYVIYRISRAKETYFDAELLAESKRWNSCINRLYYSCFYMVSALLVANGFESKTHSGIRTKFFNDYIKSGIIDKDFGKLYSDLFDWRNEGDYVDFIQFNSEIVIPLLNKTNDFLKRLEDILKDKWK
jgi:uncharacterized protein (UPF0332 family)